MGHQRDASDPEQILAEARQQILACENAAGLKQLERDYLGKQGVAARLLASIAELPAEQRRDVGRGANLLKQGVGDALEARRLELASASIEAERSGAGFDATLPPARQQRGSLHPLTLVTRELEDLFRSMGYQVLDGPEVELDYYNFEALNIARDHPARDSHDTFFCQAEGPSSEAEGSFSEAEGSFSEAEGSFSFCEAEGSREGERLVMRTHTSPVQVRAMERLTPPYRIVVPGKCFRQETTDATHDHTFHQMEGLVIGEDISVAHLICAMKTLLRGIFRRDLEVRLRPGYFPFVEPGFELDARCPFCDTGCSVCKRTRWIELLPCGLVHPNVLRAGGLDPERWSGFAFGLGLSRLVMLRHDIEDIRHLLSGDLRFLEQF